MKKFISMVTVIAMLMCAIYIAPMSAGAEDTLTISTAQEFKAFADSVNGGDTYEGQTVTLTEDIDLSMVCGENMGETDMTVSWTPIGDYDNPFEGTFDGGGHTISGLYIRANGGDLALFGLCGEGSQILNLVVDGSVTIPYIGGAPPTVTGIVVCSDGKIENCHNKTNITAIGSGVFAAGICVAGNQLKNCVNTGVINSELRSAAMAAWGADNIDNCYYLEGTAADGGTATAKTVEQFASGEVAYLLGDAWGQKIGVSEYPVYGGDMVYLVDGKYTNVPLEYPYTINSLKLVSASGEEYAEIPPDTSFIAEIDVTKTAERSGKDYFIVAAYDENNALVSMNYIKADLPTGASFSGGVNIQKTDKLIETVKAFVWDGLSTMNPLAEPTEHKAWYARSDFEDDTVIVGILTHYSSVDRTDYYRDYLNKAVPGLDIKTCELLSDHVYSDDMGRSYMMYILTLNNGSRKRIVDAIARLETLKRTVSYAQPNYIYGPE